MFSRDSHGIGLPTEAARLALCAVLALLFWLGGDRLVGLERGFYDLCQRLTASPATAPVVIVDTGIANANPWSLPRFDELVTTLKDAGAKAIVPAAPPPAMVTPQEVERLRSLIELDKRSGRLQATSPPGLLAAQLAEAEQRLQQQDKTAAAVRAAGNVVLGLAMAEPVPGGDPTEDVCAARITTASGRLGELASGSLGVAGIVPAAAGLCEAAAAIGYLRAIPDRDGVIRRQAPVMPTRFGSLPSSAVAAMLLDLETPAPAMSGKFLSRFYGGPGDSSGFEVSTAGQILAGQHRNLLRDRLVVVGAVDGGGPGHLTIATGANSSQAVLVATNLANLASGEHITRPAWAPWVELAVALLLATLAVAAGRLSLTAGALGAVGGMFVLLMLELGLLAATGIWLQLAGLALFCLTGVAVLQFLEHLPAQRGRLTAGATGGRLARAAGPVEELDLGFSVLRQQPTTDRTKQQLYELAMEHGRKRDYARAERVFRYLAARDPGYRDVAAKLEKLSGARGVVPVKSSAPATVAEPTPAMVPQSVRTLGRYELERVIGRGAMGTVYLGRDPTIKRRVAIKTLPLAEEFAESDLETARSHFKREAESAGRLNHPNIISIHDVGEDNHVAYLAMEYCEGRPLSHYAQLGRLLPPRVVFELMALAADALHYAHAQNVVHRDVKPANILYDAATDVMKLTDFGIARLTDASRTRTGIILGTPSYMSPEQLSASKVSGQSDLYSLGVTLYHLLTGAPPFQADSIPRLMEKIVHQRHRPVADIRDDVPPCTDSLLDKALAKNPADRFPSGRAMALALRECCSRLAPDSL